MCFYGLIIALSLRQVRFESFCSIDDTCLFYGLGINCPAIVSYTFFYLYTWSLIFSTYTLRFVLLHYVGVSLKTQELYAIVFATRYLDIFTDFISLYNTVMKLIFLSSSFSIVWYMRSHKIVRRSYDKDQDTFRHWLLVVPCLILACLINEKFTFKEVLYILTLLYSFKFLNFEVTYKEQDASLLFLICFIT